MSRWVGETRKETAQADVLLSAYQHYTCAKTTRRNQKCAVVERFLSANLVAGSSACENQERHDQARCAPAFLELLAGRVRMDRCVDGCVAARFSAARSEAAARSEWHGWFDRSAGAAEP